MLHGQVLKMTETGISSDSYETSAEEQRPNVVAERMASVNHPISTPADPAL